MPSVGFNFVLLSMLVGLCVSSLAHIHHIRVSLIDWPFRRPIQTQRKTFLQWCTGSTIYGWMWIFKQTRSLHMWVCFLLMYRSTVVASVGYQQILSTHTEEFVIVKSIRFSKYGYIFITLMFWFCLICVRSLSFLGKSVQPFLIRQVWWSF